MHGPVPERVKVNLEPLPAEQANGLGDLLRRYEQAATVLVPGRTAVVGLGHRRGQRLTHPVHHDLDGGGAEPARCGALTPPEQIGDLAGVAGPVPPQGRVDVRGQPAFGHGRTVGAVGVGDADVRRRTDDGILPVRDAPRVQVGLARTEPGGEVGGGRGRNDARDQPHRPVVQRAGGLAPLVALDPAVGGVGRVPGDPGPRERRRADPGAVMVAVRQEHGTAGGHRFQVGGRGDPARERLHGPAAAEHPVIWPESAGVPGDGVEILRRLRWPTRLQRRLSRPPPTGWTCASPNAGMASRPFRSITCARGPAISRASAGTWSPRQSGRPPRRSRRSRRPHRPGTTPARLPVPATPPSRHPPPGVHRARNVCNSRCDHRTNGTRSGPGRTPPRPGQPDRVLGPPPAAGVRANQARVGA